MQPRYRWQKGQRTAPPASSATASESYGPGGTGLKAEPSVKECVCFPEQKEQKRRSCFLSQKQCHHSDAQDQELRATLARV
eukprot:3335175-Rhodomonas_salina.1